MYQTFETVLLRRLGYQPTRLREIMKSAELFEVSQNQAIGARRSYLWGEWDYFLNADVGIMTWQIVCRPTLIRIIKEIVQLSKDLCFRNRKTNKDDISPDMIQNARECPVEGLLDWTNGRSLAWCHPDRRPSLYVSKRINKVTCPVCDKRFDAIDIVMNRDGLSFPEAVKRLCS
jgi:hypothetical protein